MHQPSIYYPLLIAKFIKHLLRSPGTLQPVVEIGDCGGQVSCGQQGMSPLERNRRPGFFQCALKPDRRPSWKKPPTSQKFRSVPNCATNVRVVRPRSLASSHSNARCRLSWSSCIVLQPFRQRSPGTIFCREGDELRIVVSMSFQRIRFLIAAAQMLLGKLADGLVHAERWCLTSFPKTTSEWSASSASSSAHGSPGSLIASAAPDVQPPARRQSAQYRALMGAE